MPEENKLLNRFGSMRDHAVGTMGCLAVLLTFLLPLKFGVMTGIPEAPVGIPSRASISVFMIMFWPSMLLPIFSSLLLIGVVIFSPPLEGDNKRRVILPLSWVLLFLSTLPGFLNASTFDFPIIQTATISGYAAFALALYRLIELRPDIQIWLINSIIISSLITVMVGLNQYQAGFQETLKYVYDQELKTGVKVSSQMMHRLLQTRVFSTFSICNSFAAHIILTLPICIWGILNSKLIIKSVITVIAVSLLITWSPPATNQLLFFPIAFILLFVIGLTVFKFPESKMKLMSWFTLIPTLGFMLSVLYLTQSRGGIVGLGVAIIFFMWIIPIKTRYKSLITAAIICSTSLLLLFDIDNRDFASFTVRLDYCLRSLNMFLRHPLAGTGWGDFFHEYTKIKTFPGTEAPHNPHNFIMSFTSQAGITGLIASCLVLFLPFYIFFKKIKGQKSIEEQKNNDNVKKLSRINWLNILIITGWCAWGVHSLADFNIQVQGSVATAIIMILILNNSTPLKGIENKGIDTGITGRSRKIHMVFWYGVTPLIALICIVVSIHQLKFETCLIRFKEVCSLNISAHEKPTPLPDAKFEYLLNKCSKKAEYSPIPWIIATQYGEIHEKWNNVELYSIEAIKRSPERASCYYHLALAQKKLGKINESLKNLKIASELFPNNYKQVYEDAIKNKY